LQHGQCTTHESMTMHAAESEDIIHTTQMQERK